MKELLLTDPKEIEAICKRRQRLAKKESQRRAAECKSLDELAERLEHTNDDVYKSNMKRQFDATHEFASHLKFDENAHNKNVKHLSDVDGFVFMCECPQARKVALNAKRRIYAATCDNDSLINTAIKQGLYYDDGVGKFISASYANCHYALNKKVMLQKSVEKAIDKIETANKDIGKTSCSIYAQAIAIDSSVIYVINCIVQCVIKDLSIFTKGYEYCIVKHDKLLTPKQLTKFAYSKAKESVDDVRKRIINSVTLTKSLQATVKSRSE